MSIKIKRNEAGNCIEFQGSSNPVYWNACLSGEVDSTDTTKVNVINDIKTAQSGETQYEFFRIPFGEFIDEGGSYFSNAQEVADYITIKGNVSASDDINVGYKGVFDASTNSDPTDASPINGDWYYIGTEGTINAVHYKVNDIIKYNEGATSWEKVENKNATVTELENSALDQFNVHVDSSYTGTIRNGSALYPYSDLATAITNSNANDSILVKGINIITNEIVLPHSLSFYGANEAEIKYANFDESNDDIFSFTGDMTQKFIFKDITFKNAGGYALYIKKTNVVEVRKCEFYNNGWNGLVLNTVVSSAVSGMLGYDSTQAELQSFYAGVNASNGGAIRIQECTQVEVVENIISKNFRGIRVQDCGIGGYGYISRNQVSQNIESGIYLASSSYNATGGCENFTVYNNASKYNSNNGVLVIGGIDNVISLNIVEGNWNAGVMGWHVSNTRFRDLDLTSNNRSQYNGIGNTGDAHSSIAIGGGTSRTNKGYIVSVLGCEVYNTWLGSNTSKIGLQVLQDVTGATEDYDHTLINIDDVGFHQQDYAIDCLCDLSYVKLTIGDCRYIETTETNINISTGSYYEQPFSNHITNLKECDFSVDGESVILKEGVNGVRLNPYTLRDLQANLNGSNINIMLKGSEKIQFNLDVDGVSIDGSLLSGTDQEKVNELNAMLQHSGSSTGEAPVITSSLAINMEQGSTLNYELTADYGVAYEWDLSNVSGIATVDGHVRRIIGGSSLVQGVYNIPIKAINYNGEDSKVIVLTVSGLPYENTKSIRFNTNDYLSGAALTSNPLYRSSGGSGSSDAWSVSFWFKAGTSLNAEQTILMFGGSDQSGEGRVQFWYDGSSSDKNIRLRYGNNYNYLEFKKPGANLVVGDWYHFLITYDGGSTGASSSNINNYYGRFNFFVNGVYKNTTNSHYNYGWNASIKSEYFTVGRNGNTSNYMRNGCFLDELAIWSSDQSSNVDSIYNGGVPFDLSSLPVAPSNWWRMGDGDTYPTIQDNIGNTNLTMNSMTASDIVSDTP